MLPAASPADRGEIAGTLRIAADNSGFFKEAHPKLRPVETLTAGIFLAGTAQAPKDIPETVSQASAALRIAATSSSVSALMTILGIRR